VSIEIRDKSNRTVIREVDESNNKLVERQKKHYRSNLDAITRDNFNIMVGIPQISGATCTKRVCPQCNKHLITTERICDICNDLNHGVKHKCYCDYHTAILSKKTFKIKHKLQSYADYVNKVWETMKALPGAVNDTN
jgi:hypothetical protein